MSSPRINLAALRDQFRESILASNVVTDELWGQPCLGYNIFATLPNEAQFNFQSVQAEVMALAPDSLYACPPEVFHITAAWILGTPQTYSRPKQEIWSEIRERCITGLREVCHDTPSFTVRYTELIATDKAIIAVGTDDGSMNRIRDAIARTLPIPSETQKQSRIIHTTLFRYRAPLTDPERFLKTLDEVLLDIT
ncbi:MAG: hypothetical protein EON58_19460, partial [Alphaproteobacteria bacterium]